ncbi:MAG: hypothetical protein H7Y37_12520 [Anaerolineae bacterium]|nr:hypothetical protein [Gloeobacterales cyanobacterium ES-bin-313]
MGNLVFLDSPLSGAADAFVPTARTWVKLRERVSDYSSDEALLLCEEADGKWLLWVPDFGVATLGREQLCRRD